MSLVHARGGRWLRVACIGIAPAIRGGAMSMTAAALVASAAAVAGCGGGGVAAPPTSLGLVRDGHGAGPDVAHIAQPNGERLQLALWLDAGARDVEPPQIATLAAWLAADAAGADVEAEVFPDGIELTTSCRKRELAACLGRLQRGLSLRRPDPARFTAARDRLV